jgi:hypothetical protein
MTSILSRDESGGEVFCRRRIGFGTCAFSIPSSLQALVAFALRHDVLERFKVAEFCRIGADSTMIVWRAY